MTTTVDLAISAAHDAAEYLLGTARWSNGECLWQIVDSEAALAGRPNPYEPAGASLYRGTAGIALFLLELYAITGNADLLNCAEGATAYATRLIGEVGAAPMSTAHGRIGIAYVIARGASITGAEEWTQRAKSCLEPVFGHEQSDHTFDLMSGCAGAIPALLRIATLLNWDAPKQSAIAAGRHLVLSSTRRASGYSWSTVGGYLCRQDLTGLSHGASGCGAALLALHQATGDPEFRFVAEQALAYEDSQFDAGEMNWPDFRDSELKELGRLASKWDAGNDLYRTIRARLAKRSQSGPAKAYAPYWCNGAPGIGIARAFAYKVLRNPRYRRLGIAAAETTARSFAGLSNCSLCHGSLGNVDALLLMSRGLEEPALCESAIAAVDRALADHGSVSEWPSGAADGLPDPSLFVGVAGIGLALLRLAYPEVPSILLFGADVDVPPSVEPDDVRMSEVEAAVSRLRRERARHYFEMSLAIAERPFEKRGDLNALVASCDETNVLLELRSVLRARADVDTQGFVADALKLEGTLLDAELSAADWIARRLALEARADVTREDIASLDLRLAASVRVVTQRFDWLRWSRSHVVDQTPSRRNCTYLVFDEMGSARFCRIGGLGNTLLPHLSQAVSAQKLIDVAGEWHHGRDPTTLRHRVLRLLHYWYLTGLIDDVVPD